MVRDVSKERSWGGMQRGAPSLRVRHNREGDRSHPRDPHSYRGSRGPACTWFYWQEGHDVTHHVQTKELSPEHGHRGCTELWIGAPFPLSARHQPAIIDPETWWGCTEGILIDDQSWGLVLLLLLFWREARDPRRTRPAMGFTGAEASTAYSPLPSHWLLLKTFTLFPSGFSMSQRRKLSL